MRAHYHPDWNRPHAAPVSSTRRSRPTHDGVLQWDAEPRQDGSKRTWRATLSGYPITDEELRLRWLMLAVFA